MPQGRAVKLSVVVICCNEADRIQHCLESVAGWADEIVVFDSGSTDGTATIARRYTDKVWVTDWPGYGPQRNRALAQATGEWVLTLDADEAVTPELRAEIDRRLSEPDVPVDLFKIPWRTHFMGGVLRHGRFTSPQARLFRRSGARYRDHQVHESLILPQRRTAVIKAPIDHHSWRSYRHLQDKHLKYAWLLAEQKFAAGERCNGLGYAVLRLFVDFFVQYLVRLSILDGKRGLMISLVLAQYAFHKYAALWSLTVAEREGRPSARPTPSPAGAMPVPAGSYTRRATAASVLEVAK